MSLNNCEKITKELDYHLMWYKWMSICCPDPKQIYSFKKMSKDDQIEYLKEKTKNIKLFKGEN